MDGGTQPRCEISQNVVVEYADAIGRGETLPPPVAFYDGQDYWLADGFHRAAAVRQIGNPFMLCEIRQGTRRDAVLFSVGANSRHGLPRTNADKRRGILTLLNDPEWITWSDGKIAKQCHVDPKTVAAIRSEITPEIQSDERPRRYMDRYGNEGTMNTANIGRRRDDDFEDDDDEEDLDPTPTPHQQAVMDSVDASMFILDGVREMLSEFAKMPPAAEAVRRLPRKLLRSYLDPATMRGLAKWLEEFADGIA